jgi:hypothetical protein
VIVHGIDEFMDDLRRTWCGIDLAPMYPRQANDAIVDCMTCLVRGAGRTNIVINPDGTYTMTDTRPCQ